MSDYTIGEIAAWLLAAGGLGFVLGWLVRELQVRARRRRAPRPDRVAAPAPVEKVAPSPVEETEVPPEPEPEPEPAPKPRSSGTEPPSADHLIKGNTSSMIYHLPDSPSYARTKAGVWFRTEAEAEEAGFRKAGAARRNAAKKAPAAKSSPRPKPPTGAEGA